MPVHSNQQLDLGLAELEISLAELGIIIVDHGSRRAESNLALLDVVAEFKTPQPNSAR